MSVVNIRILQIVSNGLNYSRQIIRIILSQVLKERSQSLPTFLLKFVIGGSLSVCSQYTNFANCVKWIELFQTNYQDYLVTSFKRKKSVPANFLLKRGSLSVWSHYTNFANCVNYSRIILSSILFLANSRMHARTFVHRLCLTVWSSQMSR